MSDEINLEGVIAVRPAKAFGFIRGLGVSLLLLVIVSLLPISALDTGLSSQIAGISPILSGLALLLLLIAAVGATLSELTAANHTIVD